MYLDDCVQIWHVIKILCSELGFAALLNLQLLHSDLVTEPGLHLWMFAKLKEEEAETVGSRFMTCTDDSPGGHD